LPNLGSGRWADFATPHRGGDVVSLVAYLFGLSQVDGHAMRSLVEEGSDDGVADAPGATRHNHHLVRESLGHWVLAPLRLLRCNRFR